MTSAIVDKCEGIPEFITSFFYCQDGSTAVSVLKGLAYQLLDRFPQMLPQCHTRRSSSGEPSLRSPSQAKKVLEDFCSTIPRLFIIVDGLDECELVERKQVLDILTEVVGQRELVDPGTIRLLIASQDYADIRRGLNSAAASKIAPRMLHLSETDNEGDIRAYTRMWVDRICIKFPELTDDIKEYLQNLTVANAKGMLAGISLVLPPFLNCKVGMFLYAKLVLLDLHASMTLAELLNSIRRDNFPHQLKDA